VADLTTLAAVAAWLEQEPGQGDLIVDTDGLLIGEVISGVSADFERETGRRFALEQHDETYDGRGATRMFVRNSPIVSVASVTIDGRVIPAGNSTSPGWYHDGKRVLLTGWRFSPGAANVGIVYQGGFETIPRDLAMAATRMVAIEFRARAHLGLASQSMAQQNTMYLHEAIPVEVERVLARYRRVVPV